MALQLVELQPLLTNAIFDPRYATTNNVTGAALQEDAVARLQPAAAEQLAKAAEYFGDYAMRVVIWDAYRPVEVQEKLLAFNDDDKYVLDPNISKHPLGLALDITLAYKDGELLDMGTDFDDFSPKAHLDTEDLTYEQRSNRSFLAEGMEKFGFSQWPYEWWHFDFEGVPATPAAMLK
jgi:D-alanyl-D-alanine dipeptidase